MSRRKITLTLDARAAALAALGALAFAALLLAAAMAWHARAASKAVLKAQGELGRGFGSLAAETLEPFRSELTHRNSDCQVLVWTYTEARRADRLAWAAQACLENERHSPDVYIGLAQAYQLQGRPNDAISALQDALPMIGSDPMPHLTLARLYRQRQDARMAVDEYRAAIDRFKEGKDRTDSSIELLAYLGSLERYREGFDLAERLKDFETNDAYLELVIAKSLRDGGKSDESREVLKKAVDLMAREPAWRERIGDNFNELLKEVR